MKWEWLLDILFEKSQRLFDIKDKWLQAIPVYHRMYYSGGSWHRPQNSHAVLLDKYWTKLQMGIMTREELKKVSVYLFISSNFPAKCLCLFLSHLVSLHAGSHLQISEADGGGGPSPGHLLSADRTLWPRHKQPPNPWRQSAEQVCGQEYTTGRESLVTEVRPSSLISLGYCYKWILLKLWF